MDPTLLASPVERRKAVRLRVRPDLQITEMSNLTFANIIRSGTGGTVTHNLYGGYTASGVSVFASGSAAGSCR